MFQFYQSTYEMLQKILDIAFQQKDLMQHQED